MVLVFGIYLALNKPGQLLSMEDEGAFRFNLKCLHLYSEDEQSSQGFGTMFCHSSTNI